MRRDGKASDGKPLPRFPSPEELIRFLSKVRVDKNGHWIFNGWPDEKGYRKFWFAGKNLWAHRFSQQVFNRELKRGEQANHADCCRTPGCVNPDHMNALTVSENTADGNRNRKKKKVFDCPI